MRPIAGAEKIVGRSVSPKWTANVGAPSTGIAENPTIKNVHKNISLNGRSPTLPLKEVIRLLTRTIPA